MDNTGGFGKEKSSVTGCLFGTFYDYILKMLRYVNLLLLAGYDNRTPGTALCRARDRIAARFGHSSRLRRGSPRARARQRRVFNGIADLFIHCVVILLQPDAITLS